MTRRHFLVFLVVVAAMVVWWFGKGRDRYELVNFPPTATGPWVAFGDSLTEGYGASEGHDYPAVLGQRLGVKVRNLGVGGHTTADGLKRVEEVAGLHPRVVLLCLGGNDVLGRLPREEILSNLRTIIDRLHREGSFVVLLGVRSASLRDKNEKLFRALAREKGTWYVPDILRGVFGHPAYMGDTVHPNDRGYEQIAIRLEQELRPLLPKLASP